MSDYDVIIIGQSDAIDYDAYSSFPLDRLDLFRTLVYPRMVHLGGKFRGHLDVFNQLKSGKFYDTADYPARRELLNIWNLPGASGIHLANYLMGWGIRSRVINNLDSEWDLFEEAYRDCSKPPLVGISSTFYLSWRQIGRLTKKLLALDSDMEIAVGGAFANAEASTSGIPAFEKSMRRHGVRYVLHAFNSEEDLRDLLLARKKGSKPEDVLNLCHLDAGEFAASPAQWHAPLLEDAPANWDKLELPFLNRTIQIRTASGCPFSCSFCSYPVTAGGWKTLEVDRVRSHLESVLRIPGVDRIIFIDDTFNVPPHRFRELLKLFSEYDFEWFSFLRVQYANEDTIRAMRDSGCRGVYLGIESANDRVLKNMNKKATRADFCRGLELLNRYGILSLAAFVLGFPGENDESIRDNIEFIENHGVTYYSLKEFFYISETKVDKERSKYGLVGQGAKWSHDTMDSDGAARLKIDMFKQIKNSTFIDPDTSLWYFAYLYDQGFQENTIRQAQTHINNIMLSQIDGDFSENHPSYGALRSLLAATGT